MASRRIAIVLAAASLGLLPWAAVAQTADAPALQAAPAATPAANHEAKSRKAQAKHVHKAAKPSAKAVAAPAAGSAPIGGGETEASSLERRRKAFFAPKPDEAAPDGDTPSAGVTLGGSSGLSPGMGFKF